MKLFEWFVSSPVTGMISWVGLFVSIVGLSMIFRQAASAASAAKSATAAVNALRQKLDLSNAAHAAGQMEALIFAVQRGDHALAQGMFVSIKRLIRVHGLLDAVRRALRTIDIQLELGRTKNTSYKEAMILSATVGISEALGHLERDALSKTA